MFNIAIFIASLVVSYFSTKSAMAKAKKAADKARGVLIQKRGVNEPIPVIYGTRRAAGTLAFSETQDIAQGLPNEVLYMILVVCEGEVDAIGDAFINGERLAGSKYESLVSIDYYTGTDTQTANSTFVTECADFTSDFTYSGLAYAAVKIRMPDWGDKNPFSGSLPEFTFLVRGKKIYDPRKDSTQTAISGSGSHRSNDATTWEWSNNPALCILDYMTSNRHGKDLNHDDMDIEAFASAADTLEDEETTETGITTALGVPSSASTYSNDGDVDHYYIRMTGNRTETVNNGRRLVQNGNNFEAVYSRYNKEADTTDAVYAVSDSAPGTTMDAVNAVTVSSTVRPFRCDAVLDVSEDIFDNLKQLLLGCRGFLPYSQGKYSLIIDKPGSSQFSFTTDHIIGGIAFKGASKDTRYNQVRVKFPDPTLDYQTGEAVYPVVDSVDDVVFLSEDGNERLSLEMELETIASESSATNMAKAICLHSRYNRTVSFRATSEALQLTVGDVIDITYPSYGWGYEANDYGLITDALSALDDYGLITDAVTSADDYGYVWQGLEGQLFKIEALGLNNDGTATIEAREYNAGIYTYDATAAKANALLTDLPDTYNVVAPTSLVLSDDSVQLGDGTLNPVLGVSWTASTDRFVRDYEVQWKKSTDSDYRSLFSPNTNAAIVVEGIATYDVRVRALNGIGSTSDWITGSQLVDDDTTAPSAPTIGAATKTKLGIRIEWTNASDADVVAAEVHIRSSNSSSTSTTYRIDTVGARPGDSGVYFLGTDRVASGATWYAWIINKDHAGNRGVASSTVALPQVADPASSLILTETTTQDDSGNTISAVRVTWSAPVDTSNVDGYLVRWKKSTDTEYQTLTTDTNSALVEGVVIGKTYNFGVSSVSSGGVKSTEITANKTLVGDTTAPDAPSSVTAKNAPLSIQVSWENASDSDLDAVEIHIRDANSTPSGDTYLYETVKATPGKPQSIKISVGDFNLDTTYYIFLASLDKSKNRSGFTSSVNAQFSKADTGQIQDDAVTSTQIADEAVVTEAVTANAITSSVSSYTAGTVTYGAATGGVGTDIASVSITSTGETIDISCATLVEGLNSNGQGVIFQIYRDSTQLYQTDNIYVPGTNNVPFAATISDAPAAGTYTYYLKASRTFGSTLNQQAQNRFIRALELKR